MAETSTDKGSAVNATQKGIQGPVPSRIPLDRDIEQRAALSKEFFLRHYPNVVYSQLVRPDDLDDLAQCGDPEEPIYLEDRTKTFKSSVLIPAQVNADPPKQLQKKFGIDEERDVVFIFSVFILQELGVNPIKGDKVEYDGHDYEIQSTHRRDYWMNSGIPFHLSAESNRYREERT